MFVLPVPGKELNLLTGSPYIEEVIFFFFFKCTLLSTRG